MANIRIKDIIFENTNPRPGQYLAIDADYGLEKIDYSTLESSVTADVNARIPWDEVEFGSESIPSISGGAATSVTVTFTSFFSGEPCIILGVKGANSPGAGYLKAGYYDASATGFTLIVRNFGTSSYNGRVSWLAIH